MKKPDITPGQWRVADTGISVLSNQSTTGVVNDGVAEAYSRANARFIAAAPAMAEALEAALAWEKEVPAPYRDFPFIRAIKAALIAAGYTE